MYLRDGWGGQEQLNPWLAVLPHAGLPHPPCGVIVVVLCCQWSHAMIVIMVLRELIFHLTVLLWFTEHLDLYSSKYMTESYSNMLTDFFEASV